MTLLGLLAAVLVGSAVGWLCRHAPVPPIVQDVASALVGGLLGTVCMLAAVLVTWSRSSEGGLGAVSFGLTELVLYGLPIAIGGALLVRLALHKAAQFGPILLGTHAAIVLGATAAAAGALWVARGIVIQSAS